MGISACADLAMYDTLCFWWPNLGQHIFMCSLDWVLADKTCYYMRPYGSFINRNSILQGSQRAYSNMKAHITTADGK